MPTAVPFDAIFAASPNAYMLLDRELRYVAANPAYLAATDRGLEELLGRCVTDVFPHDPHDPNNASTQRLVASLRHVLDTGEPDTLALIPYRIEVGRGPEARFEEHDWSATHTPIRGADGRVEYVLQHTVQVTALRRAAQAEAERLGVEAGVLARAERVDERNAALDADLRTVRAAYAATGALNAWLTSAFHQAPVALTILKGPRYVVELANPRVCAIWGRDAAELLARPLFEALPEIVGQGIDALLDDVRSTGQPHVGTELLVKLAKGDPAGLTDVYFDFVYQPLYDASGRIDSVLVVASDVTACVLERRRSEAAHAELAQLARVLDVSRDFVGIARADGTPYFLNEAGRQMLGLPPEADLARLTIAECFAARHRARVREEVLPTALREGYWQGELHFRHFVTGEEIPVLYSVFPVRDGAGCVTALATITRDLRAQKAAEQERAQLLENERVARAQAERANRLKDEFLAMVSHELRTPLTAMLGWVRMLRSGALTPDKHARALETVERNARAQAQLIDDLLDVGRIISGKLTLHTEPVDVAGVVGGAVETVRPAADSRGVQLEVAMDATGEVLGDPARLQQVVLNLLTNAVKFTPAGGRVRVQVEHRDGAVEVRVVDTGRGIAADFLPHVFERFRQAESDAARSAGGLGLGLAIVRHLVEAHGGRVSAASEGEGRGATFAVRLPLLRAAPRDDRVTTPQRPAAAADDLAPPRALAGLHVLVVDDEEDTRSYLRVLLERCNARVSAARSAAEGLDLIARDPPDLLLSDIGMPGQDGYQFIRSVRALAAESAGAMPAVALTAFARPDDRTRALRAGYHNHVTKPVDPAELLAVVGSLADGVVRRRISV